MRAEVITMYKAILFDLDGTLIDSAKTFTQLLNELRPKYHLSPLAEKDVCLATANGVNALIALAFGVTLEDEKFVIYKQELLSAYQLFLEEAASPFFPGVENVINLINEHSVPWGIITNKHKVFTEKVVAGQPLLATAHTVISGDTLPLGKPNPAPVLHACEQLLVPAKQAIFIGDHLNDIQAGKSAGTTTGIALYGYLSPWDDPQNWGANISFTSVAEIYRYLSTKI